MSASPVVTLGFGPGGSPSLVVTLGFGIGEPALSPTVLQRIIRGIPMLIRVITGEPVD